MIKDIRLYDKTYKINSNRLCNHITFFIDIARFLLRVYHRFFCSGNAVLRRKITFLDIELEKYCKKICDIFSAPLYYRDKDILDSCFNSSLFSSCMKCDGCELLDERCRTFVPCVKGFLESSSEC